MIQINTKYPFAGSIDSRIGGRAENQDSAGCADTPYGLLVVICDGMGGGPGGKTASATTVEIVLGMVSSANPDEVAPDEILQQSVMEANRVLAEIMESDQSLRGMGTTIAAVLFTDEKAYVAHVGDSRVYKLRRWLPVGSRCEKVFRTADHSMVGQMVREGLLTEEQARLSANTNIITRAIGANTSSEATIDIIPYEKGDRFMICTDGIWGTMPEPELMRATCMNKPATTVAEKIANLADKYGAASGGHHDNLTVAVIDTKKDSKQEEPMNRKAKIIIASAAAVIFLCLIVIIALLVNRGGDNRQDDELAAVQEELRVKTAQVDTLAQSLKAIQRELDAAKASNATLSQACEVASKALSGAQPSSGANDAAIKSIISIIDQTLSVQAKKAPDCQKALDDKLKKLKDAAGKVDTASLTADQQKVIKEIKAHDKLAADKEKDGKSVVTGAGKSKLNDWKKRLQR